MWTRNALPWVLDVVIGCAVIAAALWLLWWAA